MALDDRTLHVIGDQVAMMQRRAHGFEIEPATDAFLFSSFSPAQVALRAGHDPAVASSFYTGNVAEADRQLAQAVSELVSIPQMLD